MRGGPPVEKMLDAQNTRFEKRYCRKSSLIQRIVKLRVRRVRHGASTAHVVVYLFALMLCMRAWTAAHDQLVVSDGGMWLSGCG